MFPNTPLYTRPSSPWAVPPGKCLLQFTGQGNLVSLSHPCSLWGSKPSLPTLTLASVPAKANSVPLAGGWEGGQEGQERQDWFPQRPSPQPVKPLAWNPGCSCHPHTLLYVQEASGQPSAMGKMGWAEERLPLGGLSCSQHPPNRDPWLCPAPAPIPAPKTPRHKRSHPQTTGGRLGVWPSPNLLALPPLSWAGEGVARQGKGNTQVATQRTPEARLSDFHPGATGPLHTHRSQILPPHLPPPRPRLSSIQEGKIL